MNPVPSTSAWQSSTDLLVLHAVRLAGFANTEAIAERVDLVAATVADTLRALEGRSLIERMAFADTSGWIITESGKNRDAELLREEVAASGTEQVLQATVADFESGANPRLVRAVSHFQLHAATHPSSAQHSTPDPSTPGPSTPGSSSTQHAGADHADPHTEMLRELTDLAIDLSQLMGDLAGRLPRFGRYPQQFSVALAKARAGDVQWVAGVGRLSCHTVWAELHQDLLSSLGRDRTAEAQQNGGD